MPRQKSRKPDDPTDPRIPSTLWRLFGNRTPAPTISQHNAIKAGDLTPYQAAHPNKRVVPRKITRASFTNFSFNPLSSRSIDAYYAKARAKAIRDVEVERAEEARSMALKAAVVVPAVVAVAGDDASRGDVQQAEVTRSLAGLAVEESPKESKEGEAPRAEIQEAPQESKGEEELHKNKVEEPQQSTEVEAPPRSKAEIFPQQNTEEAPRQGGEDDAPQSKPEPSGPPAEAAPAFAALPETLG